MTAGPSLIEPEGTIPENVVVHLLADLYDNPDLMRPPEPVVERFAYQGRITLVAAPRKLGKSTLAGAIAAAKSNGSTFLRSGVRAGPVLWIAADEPLGDVVRRFRAAGANRARVYLVEPPVTITQVIQTARALRPDLLVLDTISDLTARELESENDALAVKRALEPFRQLARDTGVAVLWLHHTNKATGRSRGSGVFEDMADLILHLGTSKDDPTIRTIEVEGRVPVESFEVRWGEQGFELADGELSLIQRVRQAIWANPGCSKRVVRDKVTGRDVEINVAIQRLMASGEVIDSGSANHSELRIVENTGNHHGNHWPNLSGTAWEQGGTTREQVVAPRSGSSPVGGTTRGTTPGNHRQEAA